MSSSDTEDELDAAFECFEKGQLDRAEKLVLLVLDREPDSVLALHLLGVIAGQTDRRPMAMELLRRVITLDPQSSEALGDFGHLLRMEGNVAEAIRILESACQANPDSAPARNGLGEAYIAAGRPRDAEGCYRKSIELSPELAVPHYNLGVVLQSQDREKEAIAEYRKAMSLDPSLAQAQMRLGGLLFESGKREEGLALFQSASEVQPKTMFSRMCLAALQFEQRQMGLAETTLRDALLIEPHNSEVLCQLGSILTRSGKFDEAIGFFYRAIAADPRRVAAYAGIVNARTMTAGDRPVLEDMLTQLEHSNESRDRAVLHFAIAKTFDDLKDYESAIRHYDEGNRIECLRLKAAARVLDPAQHVTLVDQEMRTFTPEFFARHADLGSSSDLPVLIVGMPRSGTTLVEQILSSHPRVGAGDELIFWSRKSAAIAEQGSFTCSAANVEPIAQEYLELLRSIDPHASRVTDKMPLNFLHLGLVHLALPKARIIHCMRNPVDTCLSIYFTHFGLMQDFAFDRAAIVSYYEQYQRLMAHWRSVFSRNCFLEIDYQELVADPEPLIRKLIAFCGLDWDDACLSPDRNKRSITTASMWQARQPVYTKSAGRWRRYEPWLGEFRRFIPQDAI